VSTALRPLLAGRTVRGPESARLLIDERPYVNFVGCSYLALQTLDELHAAARRAIALGHPWSQMRSAAQGAIDPLFDELAEEGGRFFGQETSVFLPTGYFCGPATVAGLQARFDAVFIDELAHYSLYDAATLSGCPVHVFAHADAGALQDVLRQHATQSRKPLVLTDGVFATTGRVAPLADYARIANAVGGLLFVDESHAYGVLGANGRGAAEYCGVSDAWHAGTLSKGFCAQGGLLPCSREFAARVRSLPPVRGASAGSAVSAMVAAASLRYTRAHPQRREHLQDMSQRLKNGLRDLGLEIVDTPAPITAFGVGRHAHMVALQRALFDDGLHVALSSYIGSGPEGMIRCATFADHSEDDIDLLLATLRLRL
jgi:7-keto-8-aminopelargonate synthetase-like enzyme